MIHRALIVFAGLSLALASTLVAGQGPVPAPTAGVSIPKGKTLSFALGSRLPVTSGQVTVIDGPSSVPGVTARLASGKLTVAASASAKPGKYLLATVAPTGPVPTSIEVRVVTGRDETETIVEQQQSAEAARAEANEQAFSGDWLPAENPPPDPAVMDLRSASGRALVQQINSNSFAGPALGRLQQIATSSPDPQARAAATEALKRSPDSRARGLLPAAQRGAQTDSQKLAVLDRQLKLAKFKLAGKPKFALAFIDINKLIKPTPPPAPPKKQPGEWWAIKATDTGVTPASPAELADPNRFRQIYVAPAGYQTAELDRFMSDVDRTITKMGNVDAKPHVTFSSKYKDRIVYIVHWLPGAALDATGRSTFGAKLFNHPTRGGKGVAMNQELLFRELDSFKAAKLSTFAPLSALIIYNTDEDVTANASTPTFLIPDQRSHTVRNYGVARITRFDIDSKVPMHEVAHASFNWLDEYFESSLAQFNITILDPLSPLVQLDSSWSGGLSTLSRLIGTYDLRISEILADNGADNIATRNPANTVGFPYQNYGFQGGMFFGLGVYRESNHSVMQDYSAVHPSSHQQVLKQAFEGAAAGRANDRLRNCGPLTDWALGSTVQLMLHDADKHHRWHPTQKYEVQVGWYEKEWKTCPVPNSTFTYPCYVDTWKSFTKQVNPGVRLVDLGKIVGNPTVSLVLGMLGVDTITTALPTLKWVVPYQEVDVTAPNMFQSYWWRFRANNGTKWSEWTGYSTFRRVL